MKSIAMNSEKVNALLAGTKTVSRFPLNPQPNYPGAAGIIFGGVDGPRGNPAEGITRPDTPRKVWIVEDHSGNDIGTVFGGPPFEVGDIAYVRETWRIVGWNGYDTELLVEYLADGATHRKETPDTSNGRNLYERLILEAGSDLKDADYIRYDDGETAVWQDANGRNMTEDEGRAAMRTRGPGSMPEVLSRIKLRITGVRVERLQNITEADAAAEALSASSCRKARISETSTAYPSTGTRSPVPTGMLTATTGQSNPWIWRIKFEVLKGQVPA